MAYTTETLIWQSFKIEIRYDPDPFNIASYTGEAISHIEIRAIMPENAALPITETGYRSHFTPKGNIDEYDSAVEFVKAWLDHKAQSEEWITLQENARQLNLF